MLIPFRLQNLCFTVTNKFNDTNICSDLSDVYHGYRFERRNIFFIYCKKKLEILAAIEGHFEYEVRVEIVAQFIINRQFVRINTRPDTALATNMAEVRRYPVANIDHGSHGPG